MSHNIDHVIKFKHCFKETSCKILILSTGIHFCLVKHPMNLKAFSGFQPHICLFFSQLCFNHVHHFWKPCDALFRVTLPGKGHKATLLSSRATAHLLVCFSALRSRHKPVTDSVVPVVSISAIWRIWHSSWSVSSGRLFAVAKAKALSPCLISVFLCAAKRPPLCFDWGLLLV